MSDALPPDFYELPFGSAAALQAMLHDVVWLGWRPQRWRVSVHHLGNSLPLTALFGLPVYYAGDTHPLVVALETDHGDFLCETAGVDGQDAVRKLADDFAHAFRELCESNFQDRVALVYVDPDSSDLRLVSGPGATPEFLERGAVILRDKAEQRRRDPDVRG